MAGAVLPEREMSGDLHVDVFLVPLFHFHDDPLADKGLQRRLHRPPAFSHLIPLRLFRSVPSTDAYFDPDSAKTALTLLQGDAP